MGRVRNSVKAYQSLPFRAGFIALFFLAPLDGRLYFLHVPKTAGTTLRLLLELQVGADEIYPRRDYTHARGPIDHDLVSGHFPYWFCKKLDPDFERAFKVTILRDPVERYLSYLRAKKRGNPAFVDLESVMKQRTLSKNKISAGLVDNALCRHLSADPNLKGEALLESAKQTLHECDCVLFFDHFQRDVAALFQRLGIELDEGDIPQTNVTRKEPVREELLEEIKQLNELDIQLYQYAKEHLKNKTTQYRLRAQSFDDLLQKTDSVDYHFDLPLNGNGWSYRETSQGAPAVDSVYRWVMNRPANIYFRLEEGVDYDLYFTAQTLTREIVPKVRVNQEEISLLKLDDQPFATYYGKVPKECIEGESAEFSFYSLESFPYAEVHPDSPNRNYPPLSFAIKRIRIDRSSN